MSHVPHELHDEFPQASALIHQLKLSDPRFARQSDRYHAINREIHRVECGIGPASDRHLEELKKQRLALLDEIAPLLAKAEA